MSSPNVCTNQLNPGVFIDIDGVVLSGGKPFPWSKDAIQVIARLAALPRRESPN